eukprot:7910237-Alexandrium_andersonii.AAC.1
MLAQGCAELLPCRLHIPSWPSCVHGGGPAPSVPYADDVAPIPRRGVAGPCPGCARGGPSVGSG